MHMKPGTIDFRIAGEFITLDNLLKVTGVAASGGAAKALAAAGAVKVNGQVELRKTCKIRAGQTVSLDGSTGRASHGPYIKACFS